MAGKDKDGNLEADFFGDEDLDWLDDDSEVIEPAGQPRGVAPPRSKPPRGGVLPVAPPPPPPFAAAAGSVVPRDKKEAEWAKKVTPAPADPRMISTAKTLIFSQVPTLPPVDDIEDEPTAEASRPPRRVSPHIKPVLPEEPTQTEVPRPAALKMSSTPPTPQAGPQSAPVTAIRSTPRASAPALDHTDAETGWREMSTALMNEAAVVDGDTRADLLFRAGWIFRHKLSDNYGAESLYRDALNAGSTNPVVYRELADLYLLLERWSDSADLLEERGAALDGLAAAEAFREAAQLHFERLGDSGRGLQALRRGLKACPSDFPSLVMLKESLPEGSAERDKVLSKIAELSDGALAAEAYFEQGKLRESRDPASAIESYQSAVACYPDHGPSFMALEALYNRLGDHRSLARLYARQAESDRDGEGWWRVLSGRHFMAARDVDSGERAFAKAVELGWSFATRERQAQLLNSGSWKTLEASLLDEVTRAPDGARPFLQFRLGWMREAHLEDLDGAIEMYRAASASEGSLPARDGVLRVMRRKGDVGGLRTFLEERLTSAEGLARKVLHFRLAEAAEEEGEPLVAARWYREVVKSDPGSATGLAGLTRTLAASGEWEALRAVYDQRADHTGNATLKAHFLYRAASVGAKPAKGTAAAIELHKAALECVPDHLASLEEVVPLLEARGEWGTAGELLAAGARATDDKRLKLTLLYRAGRLLAKRPDTVERARACLATCIELQETFEPALQLSLELSAEEGDLHRLCGWYRGQAARSEVPAVRQWSWFASAVMAGLGSAEANGDLQNLLRQSPAHPGALQARETVALASSDHESLVASARTVAESGDTLEAARACLRWAALSQERGERAEVGQALMRLSEMSVEGRPLCPAARLARRAGARRAASVLFEQIGETWATLEGASVAASARKGRESAVSTMNALLDAHPDDFAVALVAARIGGAVEDLELMARGQAGMSAGGGSSMHGAHALWAAERFEDLGDVARAATLYGRANAVLDGSSTAAAGLLRTLVASGDGDALADLDHRQHDVFTLAAALTTSGRGESAEALLAREASARPSLPVLMHLERSQQDNGNWRGAFETLTRRDEMSDDDTQKAVLDHKRRWILAEKLADSEEAWAYYKALHDADPSDREVTEALARISGARGETVTAVGYLNQLAESSGSPGESARYKRRIAEAYLSGEDPDAARQAFLDALDFVPSDEEALAGLRKLASDSGDWAGMVQVLQREAALADSARRVEIAREIATITEENGSDPNVAMDGWRAVLDLAPQDPEALQRLAALSESASAWDAFVDAATVLAALSSGAERTSLLRRVGVVYADELGREEAVQFFERAISEEPPDVEAAQRLEALYRARGDLKGVERTLDVQGRAGDSQGRVDALVRAARLQLESNHDREAASRYYQRVIALDPEHEPALRFMASHLFEAGRFEEALPVCERLEPVVEREQDLDDFDVRMELAQFYFYFGEMLRFSGDNEGALKRYSRALELNPTHLRSLEVVGPLYCEGEQWRKAENVYRQLLQLSGGQGERHKVAGTYTQLGLVERALGNPDKAQKRFNKALEIYPNHVDALKGMALLLEDREDWSNLLNIFNNIIYHATVADDVVYAYMNKGRVLDDYMARPDKAAQHYERSVAFQPEQPKALLRLAELEMRKEQYQAASDHAAKALKLSTVIDPATRRLLLLCQAAGKADLGRTSDAEALLGDAVAAGAEVSASVLQDLDALRQYIKEQLPR